MDGLDILGPASFYFAFASRHYGRDRQLSFVGVEFYDGYKIRNSFKRLVFMRSHRLFR